MSFNIYKILVGSYLCVFYLRKCDLLHKKTTVIVFESNLRLHEGFISDFWEKLLMKISFDKNMT